MRLRYDQGPTMVPYEDLIILRFSMKRAENIIDSIKSQQTIEILRT